MGVLCCVPALAFLVRAGVGGCCFGGAVVVELLGLCFLAGEGFCGVCVEALEGAACLVCGRGCVLIGVCGGVCLLRELDFMVKMLC